MASHDRGGRKDSKLRLSINGVRVTVDVPPSPLLQGMSMPSSDWLPFAQTELRIIRLLVGKQAMSREQIASALDESPEGRLKGILAILGSRKVVLVTADGYQLNATTEERPAIREWLDMVGRNLGEQAGAAQAH